MATAGYTSIGVNTETCGSGSGVNNPVGLLITMPEAGSISMITARVNMTSTTKSIFCRLYDGSAGALGALQATSNSTSVTSAEAWYDFIIASPFNASATTYWIEFLGYGGDGPGTTLGQIKYDTGGGANTGYSKNDSGTPAYNTRQYSLYATYAPSGIVWNMALV